MNEFVLIITLIFSGEYTGTGVGTGMGGAAVAMETFSSMGACKRAGEYWKKQQAPKPSDIVTNTAIIKAEYVCAPK